MPFIAHRRYPLALGVTVAAFLALAGLHSAFYGLQLFAILCGDRPARRPASFPGGAGGEPAGDAGRTGAATSRRDDVVGLDVVTAGDGRGVAGRGTDRQPAGLAGDGGTRATLERERVERDRQAALAERIRIARELHDIVAHSSAWSPSSPQPYHLLDNPTEAARSPSSDDEPVGDGRDAPARRRAPRRRRATRHPDTDARRGRPAALIAQLRAAGLGVDYAVEGSIDDLPAGIDTSAYRIVQEALTNVIKHGGPIAHGDGRRDADTLRIGVHDDGAPTPRRGPLASAGGHGLIGMRERVAVFGGRLPHTHDPAAGSMSPRPCRSHHRRIRIPDGSRRSADLSTR